jgi:DNA-binding response OmpR family regulator
MKDKTISQPGESTGAPLPRCRILLVEDDSGLLRLNAEVLKRSGYDVDAVEDGAAAWDTLQLNRYDLMVTDNKMPRVSGVELLKKLQAAGYHGYGRIAR